MTIIEKIIQHHSQDEVKPGRIVWLNLDLRTARDFGGPNVVKNYEREYGDEPVDNPKQTFFTFDLCTTGCLLRYADNQQICRLFAQKHGIKVYDVNWGIGTHVLIEEGLAKANTTCVGTDSHMNLLGAVGSFGQGMGDVDITFAFRVGRTWFEVPETVKIKIVGQPSPSATAKDLTLFLLRQLGTRVLAEKVAEFYGPAVESLSLAGRITLCSMITEMAGIIGFIPQANDRARQEIERYSGEPWQPFLADSEANYAQELEINVDGLVPQVALPPSPSNVYDLKEVAGRPINSGFIGSCTNGRVEDLEAAAKVLAGRKIREGVILKVVPATRQVYEDCWRKGIMDIFLQSGAIIMNPGCGGCAEGHPGPVSYTH
ncbi:MAG: aconitase family protein, partial [Candidatus Aminicenantes bacterium]|nr:aconitase family protein [Candidatus Aminicenantes bacterium]